MGYGIIKKKKKAFDWTRVVKMSYFQIKRRKIVFLAIIKKLARK